MQPLVSKTPSHLPFVNISLILPMSLYGTTSQKCTQSWGHPWKWSKNRYLHSICRSPSYALYHIGRVKNYLDEKSTETLIQTFITCRIDQCNSLLYGRPDSHIAKLQRIQNSAARIVTRTRFHDYITPVLQKLHWLSVC